MVEPATAPPIASVIVPAHDEEAVIKRCLHTLLDGTQQGELEVFVVANGCSDRTAEIARSFGPEVSVVELDVASKIAALNAGDAAATAHPRVYLDADVELSANSVRSLVGAMAQSPAMCGAPRMEIELSDRPWYIRRFFRAFAELPYVADGLVGNGVYVLTPEGRRRFDRFPEITADDLFVRNLFTPAERVVADGATFRIHPPRNLRGLLAIRQRAYRGNAEYDAMGFNSEAEPTRDRRRILAALRSRPFDMAVFIAINLIAKARLRLQRQAVRWERDDSART